MHRSIIDLLPKPAAGYDFSVVRRNLSASRKKLVVLDDDPTGTQSVHGIDVLSDWTRELLASALSDPRPCFYVLTNTRSMSAAAASATLREVTANLSAAGKATGVGFEIISRGDSTLRGYFAEELAAIEAGLEVEFDAKIVIPAFIEGGRYTIDDIHYVVEGESLVPVAETEFARDRTFGYSRSNLAEWIEERTLGAVPAKSVASIGIPTLRGHGGARAVLTRLLALRRGGFLVVNAAAYPDLEVFARGLLEAESAGRRFLLRTAASFVRVRAGIEARPLLSPSEIALPGSGGGLIVVGSYVRKTTLQLEELLALPSTLGTEVTVGLLGDPVSRALEITRVAGVALETMRAGRHAVVFTSRTQETAIGAAGELGAGRIVSEALTEIVRRIPHRPRFLLAKGGVTSSEIATAAMGMKRARVLGQASPGVPVWEMGPETRFPGMRLVVWPGNVGGAGALSDLVRRL